jgi:hypothetical protein
MLTFLQQMFNRHELESDVARQETLARAWQFYQHNLGLRDKPLVVKVGQPDDNVCLNYAAIIVDKGVQFLFSQPPSIQVGDESQDSADQYLESVWPAEQRAVDLTALGVNGGVFGDVWLRIALTEGRPRVVVLDPLNVRAEWESDDYQRVRKIVLQYHTNVDGKPVVVRETIERSGTGWRIIEETSRLNSDSWSRTNETAWNYPFPPVFHEQNLPIPNEFYGRADLTVDVMDAIRALWRLDSLVNRIIRQHAYPKPVAKGMRKQDLEFNSDSIAFLPNVGQSIELVEMTGDLASAMNFRNVMRQGLAELTHIPEIATGRVENIGQLSGLALKILYGPLMARTEVKRRHYGGLIRRVTQALLEIGGVGAGLPVTLQWADPLPNDPAQDVNRLETLQRAGVMSARTFAERMGLNWEVEQARMAEESAKRRDARMQDLNLVP